MKTVAVIGSGISGLSAAYLLRKTHKVTILEKQHYFGGHSNTIDIQSQGQTIPVDTGFIVFNHQTYPNLLGLFHELDICTQKSDMSFGVTIDHGQIEYSGSSLNQFFAQRKNLLSPKFMAMGLDILKFNKHANRVKEQDIANLSLEEYVSSLGLGQGFRQWYLYPMSSAIWSTPLHKVGEYPALTFIRFFRNHGLLQVADHPQWYTVTNGSHTYVNKIIELPEINACLNQSISYVDRTKNGVEISFLDGSSKRFDTVVFATPAHKTLDLLRKPSAEEKQVLGCFQYSKNIAYLHRDISVMPRHKKAWASWVYSNQNKNDVTVSYWMNQLQNLDTDEQIFVTLNPKTKIDDHLTDRVIHYEHPILDQKAINAQAMLSNLQGQQNTWFCGAYHRYGFHEDGIWSAVKMAQKMGVSPSWL